jgi:hypothetical protein
VLCGLYLLIKDLSQLLSNVVALYLDSEKRGILVFLGEEIVLPYLRWTKGHV